MDKTWAIFLLASVGLGVMGISIIMADAYIPPTRSFSTVYINGEPIQATSYIDKLYITTEGIINTTVTGKNVTMSAQMAEMSCPALQAVRGFDANGDPVCGLA